MMESMMIVPLVAVLLTAIYTDVGFSRIPNWLTISAMGFGLAAHSWLHGLQGLLFSLLGLLVGLGLFLILYLLGTVGGGDVKLMAAVGAMVGPQGALESGVLAMLVGGLYALGAMCYQWGWVSTVQRLGHVTHGLFLTGGGTPWLQGLALPFRLRYGLAIAGGTLLLQLGVHPFGG